jgi:hypothetical protein
VDTWSCGRNARIACGIATYDPTRVGIGLAADPSPGPSALGPQVPAQGYQTPIFVPAIPFALASGLPPIMGSQRCDRPSDCGGFDGNGSPLMQLAPLSGITWTTATGAVAAANGAVYLLDLGRWSAPSDSYTLDVLGTQTRVATAFTSLPAGTTTGNYIGLYSTPGLTPDPPTPEILTSSLTLPSAFIVWPGFTTDDVWTLTWQGALPGLVLRAGSLGRRPSGELYLAVQQEVNPGGLGPARAEDWVVGAYVDDPELGIHAAADWGVGDSVQYVPDLFPPVPCLGHEPPVNTTDPVTPYETSIESILPRGTDPASFPGGALVLAVPAGSDVECLARQIPLGTSVTVALSVQASGLVLTGVLAGYAGRPEFDRRFNLAWQPEDFSATEAQVLARKARRFYYPGGPYAGLTNGGPCPGGVPCYPGFPEMTDPMQSGPLVGFRPGLSCSGLCPPGATPPRGAFLTFVTASGVVPMSRRITGVAAGTWVTSFDKSLYSQDESLGRVFYTTFIGDALMMVPPGQGSSLTTVIR